MEKKLSDYIHFYIGNEVRIFNEVTNEYSNWRKMTFTDANLIVNYNKKAQLHLKSLIDMSFDEYEELNKLRGNEDIGTTDSGIISKPNMVRRFYLETYALRVMEVAKKGYDLFGLVEAGLAIEMKNTEQHI